MSERESGSERVECVSESVREREREGGRERERELVGRMKREREGVISAFSVF